VQLGSLERFQTWLSLLPLFVARWQEMSCDFHGVVSMARPVGLAKMRRLGLFLSVSGSLPRLAY